MKLPPVLAASLLAMTVTACGNGSDASAPADDDDDDSAPVLPIPPTSEPDTPDVPGDAGMPEGMEPESPTPAALPVPAYQGDLSFSDTMTVDLSAFLEEANLRSIDATPFLSRDGTTVRLDIRDDVGHVANIAQVDTDTGELSWVATGLSSDTRLLFDADNRPVAAVGLACEPAVYTPRMDQTLVDITNLVPADRCISVATRVSADGSVLLFDSYDPDTGTEFLAPDHTDYAYGIGTASLVELPEVVLEQDGATLFPIYAGSGRTEYLSDDGSRLLRKMWWEGSDDNGATVRETGALLWDTATGSSRTRGLRPDLRECNATDRIDCTPTYAYLMSNDGNVVYSEVPTDERYDLPEVGPAVVFNTVIEQTGAALDEPVVLPDISNWLYPATNNDGRLLLYFNRRDSDSMPEGFTLYQTETATSVSLNRALNACPEVDESGDPIEAADCPYTGLPASIQNDPVTFTADGSSVVIRSVSRIDSELGQVVEGFIVDVDTGAVFSFPENFSTDPDRISADASVVLGSSGFPDYDLLIGKR